MRRDGLVEPAKDSEARNLQQDRRVNPAAVGEQSLLLSGESGAVSPMGDRGGGKVAVDVAEVSSGRRSGGADKARKGGQTAECEPRSRLAARHAASPWCRGSGLQSQSGVPSMRCVSLPDYVEKALSKSD